MQHTAARTNVWVGVLDRVEVCFQTVCQAFSLHQILCTRAMEHTNRTSNTTYQVLLCLKLATDGFRLESGVSVQKATHNHCTTL